MTTATTNAASTRTPQHGYTKSGLPVHAHTTDYVKRETAAQRFNAAVGL